MSLLIQFQTAQKHIMEAIITSKYYSIILDCTPDASKTEQMIMIITYISIIQSQDHSRTSEIVINESFVRIYINQEINMSGTDSIERGTIINTWVVFTKHKRAMVR